MKPSNRLGRSSGSAPERRAQNTRSRGRRNFLALGATTLVGGLVMRLDREAHGQLDSRPRFVLYNYANGIQTVQLDKSTVRSPTDFDLAGFMSPFEPYKSDVTVLQHMYNTVGQHTHGNASSFLSLEPRGGEPRKANGVTGTSKIVGGATIDQVIAEHLHNDEPLRTLVLGHKIVASISNCSQGTIIGRGDNDPIFPITDPLKAHETVFGMGGNQAAVLVGLEKSYLDYIKDDVASFQATLPSSEQQKLEHYLTSVREIETAAAAVSTLDCDSAPKEAHPNATNTLNNPEYWNYMVDLGAISLSCGATRQLSLVHTHTCIHLDYMLNGRRLDHHEHLGHQDESGDTMRQVMQFHTENVARLWKRMKETPEGAGTMADNMLVHFSSDCGGLHHRGSGMHNIVYLGNAGGKWKSGQWIAMKRSPGGSGARPAAGARPLGEAYITVAQALGLNLQTFGSGRDPVKNTFSEILA